MKKLILFIHGLGGSSSKSWGNFPFLIQKDEKLSSNYDVGFYDYQSSFVNNPLANNNPPIQVLARGLRTILKYKYNDYNSIACICHSLGGLIARKFVVEEIKNEQALRINKLLLFATPNNGAHLSKIGAFFNWKHRLMQQLCSDSDFLDNLNSDWYSRLISKKLKENIGIKYVIGGNDNIVPELSVRGDYDIEDFEVIPRKGHVDIVQPDNPEDLAFKILRRFLLETSESHLPQSGKQKILYPVSINMVRHIWEDNEKSTPVKKESGALNLNIADKNDIEEIQELLKRLEKSFLHKKTTPSLNTILKYKALGNKWSEIFAKDVHLQILKPNGILTIERILTAHKLIFPSHFPWAGRLRKVQVVISDTTAIGTQIIDKTNLTSLVELIDVRKVSNNLKRLCRDWNKKKSFVKKYQLDGISEELAHFHHEFEIIHPFVDGNGRIGRMILNDQASFLVGRQLYLQFNKDQYYKSLRCCNTGDRNRLKDAIKEAIQNSLCRSENK